jgi:hypothetical protein
MSVEQNRRLRVNDADISIAEANQFSALGNEDLLIGAEANVTSRRAQPIEGRSSRTSSSPTCTPRSAPPSRCSTAAGSAWPRSADYNRRNTRVVVMGMDLGESVTEAWTPSLRLTYFMPLLRGFGETSMRAGRLRAAAQTDIARLELANSVAGVIRDTILAYWEVVYAKQEVEIRRIPRSSWRASSCASPRRGWMWASARPPTWPRCGRASPPASPSCCSPSWRSPSGRSICASSSAWTSRRPTSRWRQPTSSR